MTKKANYAEKSLIMRIIKQVFSFFGQSIQHWVQILYCFLLNYKSQLISENQLLRLIFDRINPAFVNVPCQIEIFGHIKLILINFRIFFSFSRWNHAMFGLPLVQTLLVHIFTVLPPGNLKSGSVRGYQGVGKPYFQPFLPIF